MKSIKKNSKKKISKEDIRKLITKMGKKSKVDELVDEHGMLLRSTIPPLDKRMHPRRTMDQTVVATAQNTDSLTRGMRTYYAESEELDEVDYSDVFGYEETKDLDGADTKKELVSMGINPTDAERRTREFGKDPEGTKKSKFKKRKGFIDKMTLSEKRKENFIGMMEDMLMDKKSDDMEVLKKEKNLFERMLRKSISDLKELARREKVSMRELVDIILRRENEQ